MSDATKVSAGKPTTAVAGSVFAAVAGTAVPADATTALAAAYKELGYISEDGVTNENTPESEEVKAWGGDIVLSSLTGKPDRFTFALIECLNLEVLKMVYGDSNVTGTLATGVTVKAKAVDPPERALVFDMIMTGGVLKRIAIPRAKISEMEEITYNDTDPVSYGVTITALPDSTGVTHYEYLEDPA